MAIKLRRGAYADFDPSKMDEAEVAVVQSGDPNSNDGKAVYLAFTPGQVKRLATHEDIQNEIAMSTQEIATNLTQQIEASVADDLEVAQTAATNANTSAQTATTKASEAAQSASQAAQTVANIIDNTLTQTGKAADSKKVGDEIDSLKGDLNNYDEYVIGFADLAGNIIYTDDYYLNDSGVATSQSEFYYTSLIPVEAGKKYILNVIAGDTSNPLRVHGYDSLGVWSSMILKVTLGGAESGLKQVTITIPSGISYIKISSKNNKVIKAILSMGFVDIITSLNNKMDSVVYSQIDFTDYDDGYIKPNGTTAVSGNWKHIKLNGIKRGTVIEATVYCSTSLNQILLFDNDGNYIDGVSPSSNGTSRQTLTASVNGIVYVNFSSSYDASGSTTLINNIDVIKENVDELQETIKIPFLTMLHKIGVCGDSLSSGEIWNGGSVRDCYNYSWLSNIARDIGAECVHYSKGGLTSKAWWSDADGYKTALANEPVKPSAYYIAFGTNDKNQVEYPIGTISDVAGTDSFVGYMRSIIEYVHTQQPSAAVFLVSTYNTSVASTPYNEMIEDIADLYSYCFFIDYANNGIIQTTQSNIYVENSHFTTLGYVEVSRVIKELTEAEIQSNLAWYKHFGLNNYSV